MSSDSKPPRKRPNRNTSANQGRPNNARGKGNKAGAKGQSRSNGAQSSKAQRPNSQGAKAQGSKAQGSKAQRPSAQRNRPAAKNGPKNKATQQKVASNGNITARARKKNSWKSKEFRRSLLAGFAALMAVAIIVPLLSLIHISEPTRLSLVSRMPSSA